MNQTDFIGVHGFVRLEELTRTEVRGLDNTPPEEAIHNLARLADFLYDVRLLTMPFHISSAYRSPELNARIGGRPHSQHLQGLAADLEPIGSIRMADLKPTDRVARLSRFMQLIHTASLPFDQLIFEYGRWVHISIPEAGHAPRGEVLAIDKTGTRPYSWGK